MAAKTAPIEKSRESKRTNLGDLIEMFSVFRDINERWGKDNPFVQEIYRGVFEKKGSKPHTIDHVDCPACQAVDKIVRADLLGMAGQSFSEAAKVWQHVRRNSNSLRERTHESTDEYIAALSKFFGKIVMRSINPGMLKAYQAARKANAIAVGGRVVRPWSRKASDSRVNHEISVLAQMLKACRQWEKIRPYYFPLRLKNWSPREILSEQQEEELFEKVAGYPEAELAYYVAAITNNTTASGIELRCLKIDNVKLRPAGEISEIYIPPEACKNDHRPRKIALNEAARWAMDKVVKRAEKLGSTKPEHYLFPFRVKRNRYDPDRPATRWFLRCSWNHLRELSGFQQLRPHDLRHHAITRMLEKGVDGELVNAISGHVSQRMREFYSHQRVRVRYQAAQAIEPDYHVGKLVADGRRRSKQEKLKGKVKPQQTETASQPVQTDQDFEELKRLKIRVEQLLSMAKPRKGSTV
ncbi:MAG: tyrosine-type recombinase/integrase [Terracidiphilus sp.]